MPQPFKLRPGQALSDHPRCVENRVQCAVRIASIASYWTRIEHQMAMVFGAVTGQALMTAADTVSHSGNSAAQAAIGAIQSLATRIEVFRAATATILDASHKRELEDLIAEVRLRAGERNKIVHGLFATVESYPDDVLINDNDAHSEKWMRYTPADLEAIITRLAQTENRLVDFSSQCVWNRMSKLMPLPGYDAPEPLPQGE